MERTGATDRRAVTEGGRLLVYGLRRVGSRPVGHARGERGRGWLRTSRRNFLTKRRAPLRRCGRHSSATDRLIVLPSLQVAQPGCASVAPPTSTHDTLTLLRLTASQRRPSAKRLAMGTWAGGRPLVYSSCSALSGVIVTRLCVLTWWPVCKSPSNSETPATPGAT